MGRGIRISVETREEILAKLQNGVRNVDLALEYGLSEHTIGRISRRFVGNIFKSPGASRGDRTSRATPTCEFVEISHSGLANDMKRHKSGAERLEIFVKSGGTSLAFDIAANSEQLGLIFKLIGSLC